MLRHLELRKGFETNAAGGTRHKELYGVLERNKGEKAATDYVTGFQPLSIALLKNVMRAK